MSLIENKNTIIKYGVCRYKNIGSTCYINSILHILQQLPYFTNFIYNKKFEENINKKNINNNNLLIYELYKLFKISLENDNYIITPYAFIKSIGNKDNMWSDNNQQDSSEFLNFILQNIKEEIGLNYDIIYGNNNLILNIQKHYAINNIIAYNSEINYKSREYSVLSNIFDGLIETTRKCIYCNAISQKYDSYSSLCIPIPNQNNITIYDCFDELTNEEQLDSDNMFNCQLCGF